MRLGGSAWRPTGLFYSQRALMVSPTAR